MEVTAGGEVDEVLYQRKLADAVARAEEGLAAEAWRRPSGPAPREEARMASKRWMVRVASVLSMVGGAALAGCATTSTPVPETATSGLTTDDGLSADLNDHHRHHHQGGVAMFLALSLDTLGLPPEQQGAVTKIQSTLFTRLEPARVAAQGVLSTLADGLAAGAIDKVKVDDAVAQLESTSALVHPATLDALAQLHAVLTPPQRAALVDKVMAHWAVFRQANAEDEQVGPDRHTGHLAELATELGLSTDQVARITVSFHTLMLSAPRTFDPAEVDAHLRRLEAFRGDTFDPKALEPGAAVSAHLAARGATRMARFYEAVDPVLTPEQRARLVPLLREHATHTDAAVVAAH